MDQLTFVVSDDVDEGADLDLVLGTDLCELLDLIEDECRALRTKSSFRRHNSDGSDIDNSSPCSDDDKGNSMKQSMKPSTIAVGSIGGDDIVIHGNTVSRTREGALSGDDLVGILDEIEDSCHKFRSEAGESSSCSATITCSSSDDDSSSQGDSLANWSDQRCDSSSSSDDECNAHDGNGGDNNVGSLLAVAGALRAGAEAWAVKGRNKHKKQKRRKNYSKIASSHPVNHRAQQRMLKGPRIRPCEPLNPMEI